MLYLVFAARQGRFYQSNFTNEENKTERKGMSCPRTKPGTWDTSPCNFHCYGWRKQVTDWQRNRCFLVTFYSKDNKVCFLRHCIRYTAFGERTKSQSPPSTSNKFTKCPERLLRITALSRGSRKMPPGTANKINGKSRQNTTGNVEC